MSVVKAPADESVLRSITCEHCQTVLTETPYMLWTGLIEYRNSVEFDEQVYNQMLEQNTEIELNAHNDWNERVKLFNAEHEGCNHTQQEHSAISDTHNTINTDSAKSQETTQTHKTISQEETMTDEKEKTNTTPKTDMMKAFWNKHKNKVIIGASIVGAVFGGVVLENKTNVGSKIGLDAKNTAAKKK